MTVDSPLNTGSALRMLAHPEVLRGAWLRVDGWYQSGNLAPEPELSYWRMRPEKCLRDLSARLRSGDWTPKEWDQVPYPKKSHRLRHYVMPTVEDQVAFMAHLVLLGPVIDAATVPFAFGNRWHRPVIWDRTVDQWKELPYDLLSRHAYRSYRRSYGLFRRVAHWTVAALTESRLHESPSEAPQMSLEHFPQHFLPPWVQPTWWHTAAKPRRAFWARMDVELAYPSVRLTTLCHSLIETVQPSWAAVVPALSGFPQDVGDGLADEAVRKGLVRSLLRGLEDVQIRTNGISREMWNPTGDERRHAPSIPHPEEEGVGLPTGLGISGILLNAVLSRADRQIQRHLDRERAQAPTAVLRFADDMIVFSTSPEGLVAAVREVASAVGGTTRDQVDVTPPPTNLVINRSKLEPEELKHLFAPQQSEGRPAAGHVPFRGRAAVRRDLPDQVRNGLLRASIGPKDLGSFVTTLVERMSEIGTDTLSERFGPGAQERLRLLHDLARLDIKDDEVRPDTRRIFAANRLVRSWTTGSPEDQATAIAGIRDSIALVLAKTPWKFALWRPVVRAAARRPPEEPRGTGSDEAARDWLVEQLQLVSASPGGDRQGDNWLHQWPKEDRAPDDGDHVDMRAMYLSFHRAAFWHSLASALRTLAAHVARLEEQAVPPSWWTVRAVPEGVHEKVLAFLRRFDLWVDALYGTEESEYGVRYPWEVNELVGACLAATPRDELVRYFRRCDPPSQGAPTALYAPQGLPLFGSNPNTAQLLGRSERLARPRPHARFLTEVEVAMTLLGGGTSRAAVSDVVLDGRVPVRGATSNTSLQIDVARAFGLVEYLPQAGIDALPTPADLARDLAADPLALAHYGERRRVALAHLARERP